VKKTVSGLRNSPELAIASPKGGQPPVDPKSESPDAQTAATKRFYGDYDLIDKIAHWNCYLYPDSKLS
jgi:hypothetical protein